MSIKSREMLRGERNPNAALSKENVITIRRRYAEGVTQAELCRVYGVSITTIARIVTWQTWGWVRDEESSLPSTYDDPPEVKRTPEEEAALEAKVAASAARLKALLAQDATPAEDSGNRPFVYIPIHKQEPKG